MMRKQGLRTVRLTLIVVLGLMAITAVGAQAAETLNLGDEPETGEAGAFLSGSVKRPTGSITETIEGAFGETRILIPGKSAEIVCSEGKISEGFIDNQYENWKTGAKASGGHGSATILLSGCKVLKINATTGVLEGELTKCSEELNKELLEGLPASHHLTLKALFLVKLHEGTAYLIFEPEVLSKATAEGNEKLTSSFTTIKFGGTCSLPENVNLTGSFAAELSTEDANKLKLPVETFSAPGKALQTLLGAKFKFGANEAFLQSEGTLNLTGAGKALSWGAMVAPATETLSLGDEPETGEAGTFFSGGVKRPAGSTTETIGGGFGEARILIPGKSAEIVCSAGQIAEGLIDNQYENWKTGTKANGGHGSATILLSGCKVFKINTTTGALEGELTKCSEELDKELLKELPASHHITLKALFLLKLHDGLAYLIFEPAVLSKATAEGNENLTSSFATVKFGGTCSLPETVKLTGSFAVQVSAEEANKLKLPVETFSAPGKTLQALLGTKLKFGANEAFLQEEGTFTLPEVALNLGDEPESAEAGFFLKKSEVQFPTELKTQAVAGQQIGASKLLIPSESLEIACSEATLNSAFIDNEFENWKTGTMTKGGHGHATLLFKGCKVQQISALGALTGSELKSCTEALNKATSPPGEHHITASALISVKRHAGRAYLVVRPLINSKAGADEANALTSSFTTITFGGTCILPETLKFTGAFAIEAPSENVVKPRLKIDTFSEAGKALQSLLGTKIKFAAHEVFVQGEGEVELVGGGEAWGAM